MKPTDRQAIGIIVSLALIVAYLYFDRIDRPNYEARSALHAEILAGTAPSPYRSLRMGFSTCCASQQCCFFFINIYEYGLILTLLS